MEDVDNLDTPEHETYTEEEPNSLEPEEVSTFLAAMREIYPQHSAMTFLGLTTGLRPSSLRPLRRRGLTPDIRWDEGKLLVRRSHSLGNEAMQTTKQKVRYAINLPAEACHQPPRGGVPSTSPRRRWMSSGGMWTRSL